MPASPPAATSARPLTDYPGVYRINKTSVTTVVLQDGVLYARSTGRPFQALQPAGVDTFHLGTRVRIAFERSADGITVQRVTTSTQGAGIPAQRSDATVPPRATRPVAQLQPYVGRYKTPSAHFDVTAREGQLFIRFNEQPSYPVFPVGIGADVADRFAYDVVKAEVQFERLRPGESHIARPGIGGGGSIHRQTHPSPKTCRAASSAAPRHR